jgi:hypothetical protein
MTETVSHASLIEWFADRFMARARVPGGRKRGARPLPADTRNEVVRSVSFGLQSDVITCTCTITGATFESRWDGSPEEAQRFATWAADETVDLVSGSPHYEAWLRSSAT